MGVLRMLLKIHGKDHDLLPVMIGLIIDLGSFLPLFAIIFCFPMSMMRHSTIWSLKVAHSGRAFFNVSTDISLVYQDVHLHMTWR